MAWISWPGVPNAEVTPSAQTFELVTNTKSFTSPITGAVQTSSRKGSRWKTTVEIENVSNLSHGWVQGYLARLNGQEHRLLIRDFGAQKMGTYTEGNDTLLVDGTSSTGTTLYVKGATPSVTNYFYPGHYLSFGGELHITHGFCSSSSTGTITVPISPPIRNPLADNTLVNHEIGEVWGVFIVTNNPSWRSRPGGFSSITIEAVEDVLQ